MKNVLFVSTLFCFFCLSACHDSDQESVTMIRIIINASGHDVSIQAFENGSVSVTESIAPGDSSRAEGICTKKRGNLDCSEFLDWVVAGDSAHIVFDQERYERHCSLEFDCGVTNSLFDGSSYSLQYSGSSQISTYIITEESYENSVPIPN